MIKPHNKHIKEDHCSIMFYFGRKSSWNIVVLVLACNHLSIIGFESNYLELSVWRSGRSPTSPQQGLSLHDGVTAESGGGVPSEDVPLKELKDVEGTGLNALWPISQLMKHSPLDS